jgi:hypothetical protein
MYFREPGGGEILKAIDFGSSQLLDRKDGPENRANSYKLVSDPIDTSVYASPEFSQDQQESTNDMNRRIKVCSESFAD